MSLPSLPLFMGFRLTTESGVPISTSDRTSQGTVYVEPYSTVGAAGIVSVYSGLGNQWQHREGAATSLALSGSSGDIKDILLGFSGLGFSLSQTAAWTNATTRADAVTTQNGRLVLSSDKTKLVVGTVKYSGANVIEDSRTKRFIYNFYNPVIRQGLVYVQNSHSYTTTSYREWNAGTGSIRIGFVLGIAQEISAKINMSTTIGTGSTTIYMSVGLDSTTVDLFFNTNGSNGLSSTISTGQTTSEEQVATVGIGFHELVPLEFGSATPPNLSWYILGLKALM